MMNRSKIVFIVLIAISFLFSGNPHKKNPYPLCEINYFEIHGRIGFPVNCDAFGFIGAAISPSYLLKENYNRQSRPLYILAGTAVGYSIYALSYPFHDFIANQVSSIFPAVPHETDSQTPVLY